MPYTVHTPDGQAHTYPDRYQTLVITDGGDLLVYDDVDMAPGPYPTQPYPDPIAAYPAGQWTHYHVEPAPYETDAQASEDTGKNQFDVQLDTTLEDRDKWCAEFQRHLDTGRKAARAR